jgi:hypothetical protein
MMSSGKVLVAINHAGGDALSKRAGIIEKSGSGKNGALMPEVNPAKGLSEGCQP